MERRPGRDAVHVECFHLYAGQAEQEATATRLARARSQGNETSSRNCGQALLINATLSGSSTK
jgi:hypothetical protein